MMCQSLQRSPICLLLAGLSWLLLGQGAATAQSEKGPDIVFREWLDRGKDSERIKELERQVQELRERADRAEAQTRDAERRNLETKRQVEAREREKQQADEARQRAIAVERELQAEREREMRSRRFAATAVGRNPATRGLVAVTFVDQDSIDAAVSKALMMCNQRASDCRLAARFSGPGRCVFVAGGRTVMRLPGRARQHYGVRVGPSEMEALQRCQAAFQECRIFHTRCNGSN